MAGHSSIGASSMKRWESCPGSVRVCKGLVSKSSDYAMEGTAAHQLAETCLLEEMDPGFYLGGTQTIDKDGQRVEVEVTQNMVEAVKVYVDYVRRNWQFDTLIEHRFNLTKLHKALFGTADLVRYFPETRTLEIGDYKHGAGLAVEVIGNPQLMYYGLGALVTLRFPALFVKLTIIQPRCAHPDGPIRSVTLPVTDLLEFQARLLEAVAATEDPKAPLVTGEHCRFCPAAGVPGRCSALEGKAQAMAKVEFEPLLPYDPAKLAQALADMPAVEARIKALREFAYSEAEAGRCPPGWKLVEKVARRKWRDETEASTALVRAGITDAFEPLSLKSPSAIEKLLPKDKRGILAELTHKESSGHTLAPADDKRAAIKQSAAEDFKDSVLLT